MPSSNFPSWPCFTEEEAVAVHDVILSNKVNYWTGNEGRKFENEFGQWCGVDHAVALANGTVALDISLVALGVGPGDEVIVTPRTFIASVSSVVNAGAQPIFAEVDRNSGNISATTIEPLITPKTKCIIPVHLAGWPADMDAIVALAKDADLSIIEDCAQAHGAQIGDRSVGSFGDVGAWSFCQDKIMTTGGEGGMVTTNNYDLWNRMWSFKDHGKSYDAVYNRDHPSGFRWLHESFGTNWRMLELQAKIGRLQLGWLRDWTARRILNAQSLLNVMTRHKDIIRCPQPEENIIHAYYRFTAYVEKNGLAAGWDRDRIVAEITGRGVPTFQGSCSEVYLEKAFDGYGLRPEKRLMIAKELGETSLTFLTHPTISDDDLTKMCEIIDSVLTHAKA